MTRTSPLGVARVVSVMLLAALVGCATGGQTAEPGVTPQSASDSPGGRQNAQWPIKTREHVDLWLHGFALLQNDPTQIPFFRRGYRDSVAVSKNRVNLLTQIDANRERLSARFTAFPNLVSAQFVALYFGSWDDVRSAAELFLRSDGDPRAANSQQAAQIIQMFAGYFPTAPDRDWLRLFVQSLEDERAKFFHAFWLEEQRVRAPALAALDTLWQENYRPKMQRYLNNTQQATGDFLLSLPLDGEGRTITVGTSLNIVTVAFPARPADAREAIYVFAHEVVAAVTGPAINDETSPAEKREGVVDRYTSNAAVRGGALLLERVAPDLVDGYARYYLRSANASFTGDPKAALATTFPLPDRLRDAITRQLDVVLGGI